MNTINAGMLVYRKHPYDGTSRSGKPTGKPVRVLRVEDHPQTDGPAEPKAIAVLEDGDWAFVWNIIPANP